MRPKVIEFPAKTVLDSHAPDFLREIEFDDMHPLVELLAGRTDGGRGGADSRVVPRGRGFLALLVIIFIAQHHLRPIRQRQPEINPGLPKIQVQIPPQAWG